MSSLNAPLLDRLTRYFALLIGVAFTLAGIGGFIPGITSPIATDAPPLMVPMSYGYLLGLFPVNVLHNLFHFGVGVYGLMAYRHFESARLFARFLAVTLGVLTLMGLVPGLNITFGLLPLYGHAIWLHGLEAVVATYLGFLASPTRIANA